MKVPNSNKYIMYLVYISSIYIIKSYVDEGCTKRMYVKCAKK